MKKDKNIISRMLSSFGSMIMRLFSPNAMKKNSGENMLEEEAIVSPTMVIWKNFIHDKFAKIGLIGFVLIFLFSFLGSVLVPMDALKTETILKNIGPGKGYLKVDSDLEKEGVKSIHSGISFSIGLSNSGKVYGWGLDQENALDIPEEVSDANIAQLSVGDKHAMAATESGKVYAWGYNNFNQAEVPASMKQLFEYEGVKQVFAGEQYSAVVTGKNNLYIWGNVMSSGLDIVPTELTGNVEKINGDTYNMLVLTKDGTVASLGVKGNDISAIPTELTDGSVKVVDVAMTFRSGIALDDQGKVHVWGSGEKGLLEVPGINEKVKAIDASKNTFTVLGESGAVYAWGSNDFNELAVPKDVKATAIYSDFFQTYAVQEDGQVEAWGNPGFRAGTDAQGRDLLVRLIHGGKVTLMVGFLACIVQAFIGICVGLIAGFKGGWIDNLLMRITEIFSSIPFLPLVITLSAFLGTDMSSDQKMYLIMIILGVISWPSLARLIRGQILIEREKDFVLAARALGIKEVSIIIRHILPNVLNICIVNITLSYAGNMLTESGLSFLGFGVQAPMPSWGNMLYGAQQSEVIQSYWWQWILPALCILIAAFSINLIGDGLRNALDPKSQEK